MADFQQRTTITVNGRTYASVDEMPPDVRRQYEQVMSLMADRNNNGVPDILEGRPPGESTVVSQVTTTTADFDIGPGGLHELQSIASSASPPQRVAMQTGREEPGSGGGGITIRITWPTLLALLAVAAIAIAICWMTSSRG